MEYKIQGSIPYNGTQITTFNMGSNSQSGPVYEIEGDTEISYSLSFSEAGITGIDWGGTTLEEVFNDNGGESDPTAGYNAVVNFVNSNTNYGNDKDAAFLLVQGLIGELGLASLSYRSCLLASRS